MIFILKFLVILLKVKQETNFGQPVVWLLCQFIEKLFSRLSIHALASMMHCIWQSNINIVFKPQFLMVVTYTHILSCEFQLFIIARSRKVHVQCKTIDLTHCRSFQLSIERNVLISILCFWLRNRSVE